jgi:hypothetical protein
LGAQDSPVKIEVLHPPAGALKVKTSAKRFATGPDWTEEAIQQAVRQIFFYARS